jgi:hypothetical protein
MRSRIYGTHKIPVRMIVSVSHSSSIDIALPVFHLSGPSIEDGGVVVPAVAYQEPVNGFAKI